MAKLKKEHVILTMKVQENAITKLSSNSMRVYYLFYMAGSL